MVHSFGQLNVTPEMGRAKGLTISQVWWLIVPMPIYTLAFGGIMVPKFNLYV